MSDQMEIRRPRSNFFMVDNEALDSYAKVIGFTSWGIYTTLCRFAFGERVRVPFKEFAKLWGISTRTVIRGMKPLVKYHLIEFKKTQGVSIITIVERGQMSFADRLISRGDTDVTSGTNSDVTKMSPAKRQKCHVPGDNGVASYKEDKTFNKTFNKTGPRDTASSGRGSSTQPIGKLAEAEKIKTKIREIRGTSKGLDLTELRKLGKEVDKLTRELGKLLGTQNANVISKFLEGR